MNEIKATVTAIAEGFASHRPGLSPGDRILSGHWWVFLKGSGMASIMVNGNTLESPRGGWIVMEDDKFKAWRTSSQSITWFYGMEMWETYIEETDMRREVRERRIDHAPRDLVLTGPGVIDG